MLRRPPRSTRTDTLFPYTTLFRSKRLDELAAVIIAVGAADDRLQRLQPGQVDPDVLADLRPERRHHAKAGRRQVEQVRSEEHTSELQSLMRISYAVFCLKKKKKT